MISFFRQLRHNLLNNGKTIKYLKYAVGEIILVVIGILIALSINNKNAELAERRAERNFYENTRQQLLDDKKSFESELNFNERYAREFTYAIGLIDNNDRNDADTLSRILLDISQYSDFDKQGNIYETMVNSGDVKIVLNAEIIEMLRRLEETYLYANRMENIHYDVLMSLVPNLMESIRFIDGKAEDENFIFSFTAQNMFIISLQIMREKEEVYNRAISEIDKILELIENELNDA